MTSGDPADDRGLLAGEYVLGVQDAAARAAVEQALPGDPTLRAAVYDWQDHLLPLLGRLAPVAPDAQAWPGIEAALTDADVGLRRRDAPAGGAAAAAANDDVWRRLRRWQWTGGAAMAASIVLALLLGVRTLLPQAPPPERYLALLQGPDRSTGWVVEVTAGQRLRLLPVAPTRPAAAGKAYRFWTKPEGAQAPTSLGLVSPQGPTDLPAALLPALGPQQLFELTLESDTGSPTGRPTGPVLFLGKTVRL